MANNIPRLAPIEVLSNAWIGWGRGAFKQRYPTLGSARGTGEASDLSVHLTVGPIDERARSYRRATYETRSRGSMTDIPTPQELIRRVTGIGDPARGR